ncbi:MAG: response regulator [Elainellaceae cyanobacterium]
MSVSQSTLKKVLVVEDELQVRENIAEILGFEGFYRTTAENGRIGLQMAKEEIPDLILCDVMMPELDGYEFVRAIRSDPLTTNIPIILLTAKAERTDFRQGMELGADDYLTKPFTLPELRQAIDTQLRKKSMIAEKNQKKFDQMCNTITLSLPNELHVPLQNIIGASGLLIEDWAETPDEEKLELIEAVHSSSQRLYRLTQNFLLYASLEATLANPKKMKDFQKISSRTNLKEDVEHAVYLEAEVMQRTHDLQFDVQEAVVRISANSLKKVVREILNNAFKFSQPGSKIHVIGLSGFNSYMLHIIDHGLGMNAEQIANLDAYVQFNQKIHELSGAGLGLAVSKKIVEIHGGNLIVESEFNRQTSIRITLPILSD